MPVFELGGLGRERAVPGRWIISRASASAVPMRLRQRGGWRAMSVATANRPCANSPPAHDLNGCYCVRCRNSPWSPPRHALSQVGRDGWLRRFAGIIRACHKRHASKAGRSRKRHGAQQTPSARLEARRRGRPARWPTKPTGTLKSSAEHPPLGTNRNPSRQPHP